MSTDQEKGLDGIISEEDTKMLKYYSESLKFKSSHWSNSKWLIDKNLLIPIIFILYI